METRQAQLYKSTNMYGKKDLRSQDHYNRLNKVVNTQMFGVRMLTQTSDLMTYLLYLHIQSVLHLNDFALIRLGHSYKM